MLIHGLQKLTLLDYPEHLAAVLFTGSCNFRCPFCQNGSLVLNPQGEPVIPEEEIFSFLKKRRGILTGVCITGGEPTLHRDLPEMIRNIKDLGYQVKLDTNGTNPSMVKQLYQDKLIDYVAMDIKTSRSNYPTVSGCPGISLNIIQETIDFLMTSGIDYEFRTTAVKGLHTLADFEDIALWIAGAKRYFLQSYQDSGRILQREQQFKNASGVLAAAWSNAKHSSTDHACDPPEALSWKEIGLPPRRNCRNSPPEEVGVSSSYKMTGTGSAIEFSPLSAFPPEELQSFLTAVLPSVPSARLRGIDE